MADEIIADMPRGYEFGPGMQGSGRAEDGSIVHYKGNGCFERLECPLTASGRCATEGRTVAVDRSIVAMGTDIWIEGLGHRVAEDTGGGIRGQHIDVWYGEGVTMAQAQRLSVKSRQVCVPTVVDWEDAEIQSTSLLALHHGRLEGDESSSRPQTSAAGPSCGPQGYPCGHADLA